MNYRRLFLNNSSVFITIVTDNRTPLLINNIHLLINSYKNVAKVYKFNLIAYCVLKDHIHCIIKPNNINNYPKIVKSFKYCFTKIYKSKNDINCEKIWQNRYWEHTIKDETDFLKHIDYIHYNPIKHGYVKKAKDWKYSSFNKFKRQGMYDENWGDEFDIQNIAVLNYE